MAPKKDLERGSNVKTKPPRAKLRSEQAVPDVEIPAAYRKAQMGHTWVYNRSKEPFSIVFEAFEEIWEGHEFKMVTDNLAKHCARRAFIKWDPAGKKTVLALVDMKHKYYGVPLTPSEEKRGVEVLVRSKAGHSPTEVEAIEVID